MAILANPAGSDGVRFEVPADAAAPGRVLLVAGRPLGEPIAQYGPFVMNTTAELQRAVQDFQRGALAGLTRAPPRPRCARRGGMVRALDCAATMPRTILEEARLHPAIREFVANLNADIVHNVQAAASSNAVLVVGMAGNPHRAPGAQGLDAAGIAHHYLEYGSYFGGWRRRNALKMWTGWPTFPMVFVRATLIGGADELERLVAAAN